MAIAQRSPATTRRRTRRPRRRARQGGAEPLGEDDRCPSSSSWNPPSSEIRGSFLGWPPDSVSRARCRRHGSNLSIDSSVLPRGSRQGVRIGPQRPTPLRDRCPEGAANPDLGRAHALSPLQRRRLRPAPPTRPGRRMLRRPGRCMLRMLGTVDIVLSSDVPPIRTPSGQCPARYRVFDPAWAASLAGHRWRVEAVAVVAELLPAVGHPAGLGLGAVLRVRAVGVCPYLLQSALDGSGSGWGSVRSAWPWRRVASSQEPASTEVTSASITRMV